MTEPTFTKEQLRKISERWSASDYSHATAVYWLQGIAAFALAQMEGKEAAEAERESLRLDKFRLGQERGEEWKRAENAEAECDRLAKELKEAEEAIRGLASWFITKTVTCSEPECPACKAMLSPAVLRARERAK